MNQSISYCFAIFVSAHSASRYGGTDVVEYDIYNIMGDVDVCTEFKLLNSISS